MAETGPCDELPLPLACCPPLRGALARGGDLSEGSLIVLFDEHGAAPDGLRL